MEAPMTPDEFVQEIMKIYRLHHENPDITHPLADELIIKLLRQLGYHEGADVFNDQEKWYS